ncbi:origin recognition complex subunit 6-like [Schistocerca gregaria]|uniref:origin recognition complex subunit 6-like n=1 Tax=Schistocerca gregaria TaxID=7010 RepID=UPI00211E6C3A|nr:origin recognition complex subunit 6-like [Schistocerca gregaria]
MAFQNTYLKSLLPKLGIEDDKVLKKASELQRILDLKISSGGAKNLKLSESAKAVMCADLAALHCGITCERDDYVRLSGMKNRLYITNRSIIEKLVGMEETLDVNKICVQLGISEISNFAQTILDQYLEQNAVADRNDKMYGIIAVYVACRERKVKLQMRKFMEMCNLKKSGFVKLVADFDKSVASMRRQKEEPAEHAPISKEVNLNDLQKAVKRRSQSPPKEEESYSDWKRRMLQEINESSDDC